jgi:hypothetical protein
VILALRRKLKAGVCGVVGKPDKMGLQQNRVSVLAHSLLAMKSQELPPALLAVPQTFEVVLSRYVQHPKCKSLAPQTLQG